jgi:hypothetical protein
MAQREKTPVQRVKVAEVQMRLKEIGAPFQKP